MKRTLELLIVLVLAAVLLVGGLVDATRVDTQDTSVSVVTPQNNQ